ncbi:MAG TPA: hypothetical protein VFY93_16800 [Planctomycetota bacterium]|nr:hypothetical protein [Planctomycetota bacterium]
MPNRRLVDRIADRIVLLPAAMGALGPVGDVAEYGRITPDGVGLFAIFVGISGALHVWFRAEDRWAARRRAARAARRKCGTSSAVRPS